MRKHTVTAAGKGQLRGLTLAKLKKYAKDYGIDVSTVLEKDDLIDRLIVARVSPSSCSSMSAGRLLTVVLRHLIDVFHRL